MTVNIPIHDANDKLGYLNQTPEEKTMIDLLEKARAQRESEDYTVWHQGHDQGIRETQEATIRRGLASGFGLPDIAKMTGLDLTEIQRVASQ